MQKANCGYELQVGDVVMVKNWIKMSYYTITSTTKKYATSQQDGYKIRFPIEYNQQFKALPREKWDTNEYAVYMNVDVEQ